jgi:arylformamidase
VSLEVSACHQRAEVDGAKIHRILLAAGIWIIEGLDLSAVRAGPYDLICLPVKLHGSDGAPARAILRPVTQGRPAPDTS